MRTFPKKQGRLFWAKEILLSIITFRALFYCVRLISYRILNCEVGHHRARIGKRTNVHPTVVIREPQNVVIGDDCYFNHNTVLTGGHSDGKLIIGNNVLTGPNVGFFVANHHYAEIDELIRCQGYDEDDIVVEDNVWIGANSIVTSGVRIGTGAVIGANSVGTHNIPPYAVAAGTPANVIRIRK